MNPLNDMRASEFLDRALAEGLELLASTRFTLDRGCYSQGSLTAVSVLVSPSVTEPGAHRVRIMCHACGHLNVNWDGVPVVLLDRATGDERLGFIDRRGRVEFILTLPPETELGLEPMATPSFVAVDLPKNFFASHFAPTGASLPELLKEKSKDGAIGAEAEVKGRGELHVSVHAHDPSLRNATVRVLIRSKLTPSKILFQKKITLDQDDGLAGGWRGKIGSGDLKDLAEDAVLLVFPPRRTRD